VTVPLLKRGLLSGWLPIFVPALRELSASGLETLAVSELPATARVAA
jgi:ABC-type Fe3+ transport system permease subunit